MTSSLYLACQRTGNGYALPDRKVVCIHCREVFLAGVAINVPTGQKMVCPLKETK